jgi:hypothetical protein
MKELEAMEKEVPGLSRNYSENGLRILKNSPRYTQDGDCAMIADIEQEYGGYVCNIWQEIPDIVKLNCEPHPDPECTYDAISLASGQFLQEKLKTLEAEEALLCAD